MWEAAKHVCNLMRSAGAFTKAGMEGDDQVHEFIVKCEEPADEITRTGKLQDLMKLWIKG